MRVPYIMLSLMGAVALAGCATTTPAATLPTQLPDSVVVDDQIGISVELAYQAASLAERTAIKAGFVGPNEAQTLIKLDNQAYYAVCTVRTAYDVANGNDPLKRADPCPLSTKQNKAISYVEASRQAVAMIRVLLSNTTQAQANQGSPVG